MNIPDEMSVVVWTQLWLPLFVGVAAVVGLAGIATRLVHRAVWQRTVWQVCVLSLAMLILGELCGVATGVVHWSRVRTTGAVANGTSPLATTASLTENPTAREASDVMANLAIPSPTDRDESAAAQGSNTASPAAPADARWKYWMGALWLLGAGVILVRVLVGQIALLAFRYRHGGMHDKVLMDRLQVLASTLGLRRVHVLAAEGLVTPIAFGCIWPTIGLPRRFVDQFAAETREAMLAHELAHLAARDPAWHLFADVVTAVLWWHPLAWWSRQQLRMASEFAADEASLVVRDGPGVLAACLVELGRRLTLPRSPGWLGIEGNAMRSSLARRVTRLLDLAGERWQPPARGVFLLVQGIGPTALVAVALVTTVWFRPIGIAKGESMTHILQQSWRHSLAAVALMSVFGSVDAAVLADDPAEVKGKEELAVIELDEKENKEAIVVKAKRAVEEAAVNKQRLAAMEREIDALKAAGKVEEAEKLAQHFKELLTKEAAAQQDAKEIKVRQRKVEGGDEDLRARLKQLEAENAKLRELLGKGPARINLGEKVLPLKENPKARLEDIGAAIEKLRASGRNEEAEKLAKEADEIKENLTRFQYKREPQKQPEVTAATIEKVGHAINQLQEQLTALRHEVDELREAVKQSGKGAK